MFATTAGQVSVVELLLSKGAKVNYSRPVSTLTTVGLTERAGHLPPPAPGVSIY
jgi:hypothetical protein